MARNAPWLPELVEHDISLARNAPWLPELFEPVIVRHKIVFLGPLKSSKNKLRKSILIGLFVLSLIGQN